jgi:hypothetical protein
MDDLNAKRQLMSHIGTLKGPHEVSIKARRRTRTLDQNSYYWAAVVTPWLAWLREAEGDPSIDKDQAHEMLKSAVLGAKAVKLPDERVVWMSPRTRGMKTDEFAQYVEGAAKFLAEFCGIVVLPSDVFFQR